MFSWRNITPREVRRRETGMWVREGGRVNTNVTWSCGPALNKERLHKQQPPQKQRGTLCTEIVAREGRDERIYLPGPLLSPLGPSSCSFECLALPGSILLRHAVPDQWRFHEPTGQDLDVGGGFPQLSWWQETTLLGHEVMLVEVSRLSTVGELGKWQRHGGSR